MTGLRLNLQRFATRTIKLLLSLEVFFCFCFKHLSQLRQFQSFIVRVLTVPSQYLRKEKQKHILITIAKTGSTSLVL